MFPSSPLTYTDRPIYATLYISSLKVGIKRTPTLIKYSLYTLFQPTIPFLYITSLYNRQLLCFTPIPRNTENTPRGPSQMSTDRASPFTYVVRPTVTPKD